MIIFLKTHKKCKKSRWLFKVTAIFIITLCFQNYAGTTVILAEAPLFVA